MPDAKKKTNIHNLLKTQAAMVSSNLIPLEGFSFLKSESLKFLNNLGIEKINSIPALIGFALGGVFIIIHWLLQQVVLFPRSVVKKLVLVLEGKK